MLQRLIAPPTHKQAGADIMWRAVISSWVVAAILLLVLAVVSYAPLAWTIDHTLAQSSQTQVAANR